MIGSELPSLKEDNENDLRNSAYGTSKYGEKVVEKYLLVPYAEFANC
jgi:apolipoprotein N-acyltransferase